MPSTSSEAVDTTLIVSVAVVSALEEAAGCTSVPFLGQAAGSALSILQAVQKARTNKSAFKALAKDACDYTLKVIKFVKNPKVEGRLKEDLTTLCRILADVEEYASEHLKKRTIILFFRSLLMPSRDENEIAGYHKAIEVAFRNFNFESNVELREQSTEITTDVKEILQEVKHHGDTRATPPPSTLVINTNTNSGNTTTTTISDSNNNDSISYGAPINKHKPIDVSSLVSPPPILVAPPVTDISAVLRAKNSINATINNNINSGNTTTKTIENSFNNSSRTITNASRHSRRPMPPPSPQRLNFQRGTVSRY
ncbi:hypothetical protein K443DRAFT_683448 [Laccaria amethystina LaAM-08-1]|uniref:Uncharacterized protein n=1 Tax=Laccaria amethystina LaAM-08-1 TaxID=1095629 RepID=A0A0C9WJJ7_9AGAR|nr:hypothetical protein K443DRAFT_683448 [Laccaria amethystina LaAM-08-1]